MPDANNLLSYHTGRYSPWVALRNSECSVLSMTLRAIRAAMLATISSSDSRLCCHASPNALQAQPAPRDVPGWCLSTHSRSAALIRVW